MDIKGTRIIPIHYRMQKKSRTVAEPRFRVFDLHSMLEVVLENPLVTVLAFLLLVGTIFGALFARGADDTILQKLDLLFVSDVKARAVQSSGSAFVASLSSSFFFVMISFLFGMSLWGVFVLPFIPLFRGFGFGLASGYLYAAYGFQGVLFNAVVVLPGAFLSMVAILLAAKEGMLFSKSTLIQALKHEQSKALSLKAYAIQFGSILILSAAAAAIDLITTVCFTGAFTF
ncbi:MAG: stage II sporulation protein M [Clostridium sp.]|uniref:stage II sporulation protein M n=1 Tax=Clostridium sp. TaxID=1506 RepID=UPI00290C075C|nr:stage II sporulation protein M [Clostridium sp.]MDU7337202.1 stage II sporulation protein M [Clostridium sp.]